MGNYITYEMAIDRISESVARKIYDDDNDGDPDIGPIELVIADAERWFESVAIGVYPDLAVLRAQGGPTAATFVLDCFEAMACKRFPRAFGREWLPLIEWADKQLMRLRKGEVRLPIQGSPNPPANTGGAYSTTGSAVVGTCVHTFHHDGFGIF
jgi:hypothetical protein